MKSNFFIISKAFKFFDTQQIYLKDTQKKNEIYFLEIVVLVELDVYLVI